jgi:hypothetical protein
MIETRSTRIPWAWVFWMSLPVGVFAFIEKCSGTALLFTMRKFIADPALISLLASVNIAFNFLVAPFVAWKSDRLRTRWGGRKPFIVAGLLLLAPALIALPLASSLWTLLPAILLYQFAVDFGFTGPWSPLYYEIVPQQQRGRAVAINRLLSVTARLSFNFLLIGRFDEVNAIKLNSGLGSTTSLNVTGEQLIYWLAAALVLAAAVFVMLFVRETAPREVVGTETFDGNDSNGGLARPHPDPLPRGEGTAKAHTRFFGRLFGQSSRGFTIKTASDSPSPWGEGRGEGGRDPAQTSNSKKKTEPPHVGCYTNKIAPLSAYFPGREFFRSVFGSTRARLLCLLVLASVTAQVGLGQLQPLLITEQFGYTKRALGHMHGIIILLEIGLVLPVMAWLLDRVDRFRLFQTGLALATLQPLAYWLYVKFAAPAQIPPVSAIITFTALGAVAKTATLLALEPMLFNLTPPALLGTFNAGFVVSRGLATVLLMNGVGLWVKVWSSLFCAPLKFDYLSGYLYVFACGLGGCLLARYVGAQRRRGALPGIGDAPGARTAESARTPNEELADKAVRAPIRAFNVRRCAAENSLLTKILSCPAALVRRAKPE